MSKAPRACSLEKVRMEALFTAFIAVETLIVHGITSAAALALWVNSSSFLSVDRVDIYWRQSYTARFGDILNWCQLQKAGDNGESLRRFGELISTPLKHEYAAMVIDEESSRRCHRGLLGFGMEDAAVGN
jgi:hypothetical protein